MRTIKFRAWDGKKMLNVVNVRNGFRSLEDGEITISQLFDEENSVYVPMQFTGLKDKNGKEIYEGDIVKFTVQNEFGSFQEKIGVSEFMDTAFVFRTKESHEGYEPIVSGSHEIIGNIYENPELLQ